MDITCSDCSSGLLLSNSPQFEQVTAKETNDTPKIDFPPPSIADVAVSAPAICCANVICDGMAVAVADTQFVAPTVSNVVIDAPASTNIMSYLFDPGARKRVAAFADGLDLSKAKRVRLNAEAISSPESSLRLPVKLAFC